MGYVHVGERFLVSLPYSEVCMHLGVAGKTHIIQVTTSGMAQILTLDGTPVSFPITLGEAGIPGDVVGLPGRPYGPLCATCARAYDMTMGAARWERSNGYEQAASDTEFAAYENRAACVLKGWHYTWQ